jgi:hypothetical protein
VTSTNPSRPIADLAAENTRLRTELAATQELLRHIRSWTAHATLGGQGTPINGTLAVVERRGGPQDLPPAIQAYVCSDLTKEQAYAWKGAQPDNTGAWWPIDDEDAGPRTWDEINGWDETPQDRADVTLRLYLPADELSLLLVDDPNVDDHVSPDIWSVLTSAATAYGKCLVSARASRTDVDYARYNGRAAAYRQLADELADAACLPRPDWETIKKSVPADGIHR